MKVRSLTHVHAVLLLLMVASLLAGCGTNQASAPQPAIISQPVATQPAINDPSAATPTMGTNQPASAEAAPTNQPAITQPAPTDQTAATQPASTDQPASAQAATPVATDAADAATPVQNNAGNTAPGAGIDLTKLDLCTLLNQADIEAVMGPVHYSPQPGLVPPSGISHSPGRECQFVNDPVMPNQDNTAARKVDLWLWPANQWEALQSTYGPGQTVSGIGDGAFSTDSSFSDVLWVQVLLRDRVVVQMGVYPSNPDMATQLARKVMARLP